MPDSSIDAFAARNNTRVYILLNGERVGRVQSIREDIQNNVQVLSELGRAYAVELKKGITTYTFSIAKFYCRNDAMDSLKLGQIFSLAIRDVAATMEDGSGGGAAEILEYFAACAITSISRDYTNGAASIGENASVVTIGKGVQIPVVGQ